MTDECITIRLSMGFTLIELLISLAVSMVVLSALTGIFVIQRKAYSNQEQIVEITQVARAAMDMIGREIRAAGYYSTSNPMQCLNSGKPHFVGIPVNISRLEILTDLNGDGDTEDENEHIIYTYDSVNKMIRRNTGGGAQPFAENIQTFTFDFLDENGIPAVNDDAIHNIRIAATARTVASDPKHPDTGFRTITLVECVYPRNLGLSRQ
jgi:type IV pilus assembly protein PilW